MALSGSVLGALMKSNVDALSDADKADREKTYEAIANAVVSHIKAAGVVTVTGITAGGASAGGTIT